MNLPDKWLLVLITLACMGLAFLLSFAGASIAAVATAVPLVFLILLVVGVMVPQLGFFSTSSSRATSGRAEIALTFDDGPDPSTTPRILSLLASAGANATFFVLGSKVELAPESLRAIADAGHEIGIHGYRHDRFLSLRRPAAIAEEILRTQSIVESLVGRRPALFRPPLGHVSPRTAKAAETAGAKLVSWSIRSRDGLASTSAERVARRVIGALRPGDIVLMHDAAERGDRVPASIDALPAILEEIARRGLKCVTVSQLLEG